jgi:hypothetical protein
VDLSTVTFITVGAAVQDSHTCRACIVTNRESSADANRMTSVVFRPNHFKSTGARGLKKWKAPRGLR